MNVSHEQPAQANGSPSGPAPGQVDERVAANVRSLRGDRSQADLAAAMVALGWATFHPQTIHKIETGQRKVSVGEAEALARALGTTADRLTWARGEDSEVAMTEAMIAHVRQAWREASTAALRLSDSLAAGERQVAEARASRHERVRRVAEELAAEVGESSVQSAFEDGLARFEQGDDDGAR